MTKWSPMPIRPVGQAWQGMNTSGGKLDNGSGQQTQNSVNVTINETDRLQKRKGFVRGLQERFGTVVCGLHTYTDNCGREWVIVASDAGISIRQPFAVPVFENDDGYPADAFNDLLSTTNWRNTDLYVAGAGALQRGTGDSASPFQPADMLRWFKDASSASYEVTIQYEFEPVATEQVVTISIKGLGDLTTGRRLQLDLVYSNPGTYIARLYKATADGALVQIGTIDVVGSFSSPSGFLTLTYDRTFTGPVASYQPRASVIPTGGALQSVDGAPLSELEDIELGQVSAIGCGALASILQVTGGPV